MHAETQGELNYALDFLKQGHEIFQIEAAHEANAASFFHYLAYDDLANILCNKLHYEIGKLTQHQFPDDETVMTIDSNVSGRDIIFVAS